jgi:hypothetical protein
MPLYAIRRVIGPLTQEELDAAGFRATVCAAEHEGLRWERSFWDQAAGELICYYEAQSPEQIQNHSRQSAIPCNEVREVKMVLPDVYSSASVGAR